MNTMSAASFAYQHRYMDDRLAQLLLIRPCVRVVGARGIGKTTTAKRFAGTYYDLSNPAVTDMVMSDPEYYLAEQTRPVVLDEWRNGIDVLWRAKEIIDRSHQQVGQFIVVGSIQREMNTLSAGPLPWPLAGRSTDLEVWPMSVHEQTADASPEPFAERVVNGQVGGDPRHPVSMTDYIDLTFRGGYPIKASSDEARKLINQDLIDAVAKQDMMPGLRHNKFLGFMRAYATHSSTNIGISTLAQLANITVKTAHRYTALAHNVGWVYELPGWSPTTGGAAARKRPKRFIADTAMWAAMACLTKGRLRHDPELLKGVWIETFVGQQLRGEVSRSNGQYGLFYYRDKQGREVDFVLEDVDTGRAVFIEVKAAARAKPATARTIRYLRDRFRSKGHNNRFAGGVVLHTGLGTKRLHEGIVSAPISSLWQTPRSR